MDVVPQETNWGCSSKPKRRDYSRVEEHMSAIGTGGDRKGCMNVHVDIMGAKLGPPEGEISMHTRYIKEINFAHHSIKTC